VETQCNVLAFGVQSLSCTLDIATPGFILGAASVKFYALLAVFGLGIATFRAQCKKASPNLLDQQSKT
jgi:hypothetical protein